MSTTRLIAPERNKAARACSSRLLARAPGCHVAVLLWCVQNATSAPLHSDKSTSPKLKHQEEIRHSTLQR
uniref:Uncharacterized protein n=1 Tax=Arundo donax TaxID=35708 RepID=A0A0A9G995_ARUDO